MLPETHNEIESEWTGGYESAFCECVCDRETHSHDDIVCLFVFHLFIQIEPKKDVSGGLCFFSHTG